LTTRLILIRHGETDWNVEGRYQGQADPPLNQRGLAQAHQLAQKLRGVGLDVLYSSPLRRALQTAQILAEALDVPLHTEPRLMEIHQGEWQTLLYTEIAARYPELFDRWQTEPWTVTLPGGENIAQVQERVYAAVDEILSRHEGQCIGMVAHRLPITLLKIRYQGLDPDVVRTLQLPNTYWEEIPLKARQIGLGQNRKETEVEGI
jgi:broad specificity phosphatase PhoE